jgi:Ca2+-binding RTX toxin-like protein
VRISVRANADGTGAEIESHNSMTTLVNKMFAGQINPGQLQIVREVLTANGTGDIDTAAYQGAQSNYMFGATADGMVTVTDMSEDSLDGSDRLRNIERLQFTDGNLGIIVGTAGNDTMNGTAGNDLMLGLAGNDTLNGLGGNDVLVGGVGNDALNGGLGDDMYSFGLADGADTITETGGTDRISIATTTLTALNFSEITTGGGNDNLVISYNGQQITVVDQFDQLAEAVELVNFNGSTFNGYLLEGDYAISTDDSNPRTANVALQNTILTGTTGEDELTGNTGNDLLFGHDDDDELNGSDGDDLLVGGAGNDTLDGGFDLDTMVGGTGNDTYIVDDVGDVIVEAAGGGTDEVETDAAAFSIELFANVENLTYTGVDADPFVGTGNAGNNVITGGDLADTLTGLAGNDTLDGGLGADIMRGGLGNDVYVVDEAGDEVDETGGDGTDRVESDISYVLAAGLENLDLNDDAANGTGNDANNVINGNDAANQIFGGGGTDTLSGGDGNDLIDGGLGNDTISGGDDNDTIIGGGGDDTIDVGGGVNSIVYNTTGFGADVINSFDATGGTATNQDLIDLRGLGITATNFATRVVESTIGGTGNTLLTIREGGVGSATIGTIRVNGVTNANMDASDFLLAPAAATTITGTTGNNTLNGTAAANIINALAGNDTVNAGAGDDVITGGLGNDTVNGDAGDDTFLWNANPSGATDGRDVVNGGTEGGAGDTFVVNGNTSGETYRIYTVAAFDAIAGNNLNGINGATEIIITRNGTNAASIVAELREIEEIRINGVDPAGTGGPAGAGDTFQMVGDFSGTSLRLNTVTIAGSTGNDTIDISGLTSPHRVVYNSNGGSDSIIGTPRPQDVIEGNVSFNGDNSNNVLTGTSGNETLNGNGGSDVLNGGAGDDVLNGGAGGDTLIGGNGADRIDSGARNDNVRDTFRFGAASEFGDTVTNFDANGVDRQDDRVEFADALNSAWDDGCNNDNFLFASGNGGGGTVNATIGQGNNDFEALMLSGARGEGVTTANLGNAALVAGAFNKEFVLSAANGEDALLVINDTNGNSFGLWQWIQSDGAEISAAELSLIGVFTANGTATTGNFDFV